MRNATYWLVGGVAGIAGMAVGVLAAAAYMGSPVSIEVLCGAALVAWLLGLVVYFIWAIKRYTINYGLSDHEWAIYSPALYAPRKLLERYQKLHDEWVEQRRRESDVPGRRALAIPTRNPYAGGTFGLPPGVVRGVLALTALVMFLLMEVVNVFRPGVEEDFNRLITAFMMILAFYFGSRGVEVLQAAQTAQPKREEQEEEEVLPPAGVARGEAVAVGVAAPRSQLVPAKSAEPETPSERPAMPAHLRELRVASLVAPEVPPGRLDGGGLTGRDLATRALALTASFETGKEFPACFGAIAGDFNQEGLSFGALQWSLGAGTLQPLLRQMEDAHPSVLRQLLGDPYYDELRRMLDAPREEQLQWARQLQRTSRVGNHTRWIVIEPWRQLLGKLGTCDEMISIQVEAARSRYEIALEACREWGLHTERGVALMLDLNIQNGKVDKGGAGAAIRADHARLPADLPDGDLQLARMQIIAQRRSEIAAQRWRGDVLARKLAIAHGTGVVYGRPYDLEAQYGITLAAVPELAPIAPSPEWREPPGASPH